MKDTSITNIFALFIWYVVILTMAFLLGTRLAHFNYLLILASSFLLLFLNKSKRIYFLSVVWVIFCAILLLLEPKNLLHMIYDVTSVFCVFSAYDLASKRNMTYRELRFIFYFFMVYILAYVIFSRDSSLYSLDGDERYLGIAGGANLSSTIVCLMIIYITEYLMFSTNKLKRQKKYFYVSFFIYILILVLSKSRSLLFLFPYFVFQLTKFYNTVYILIALILLSTSFFYYSYKEIQSYLRLIEDGSYITRFNLYESLWRGIKDNYFLVPEGFNKGNEMMENIIGEKYPPHNDFLKFWYEWGIGFFFYIIVVTKIFLNEKKNSSLIWVLLFVCSTALHNILNSVYVIILSALIINMTNCRNMNYKKLPK